MKNFKRIVALLLASVMVVGLAACGTKQETASAETEAAKAETEAAKAETEAAKAEAAGTEASAQSAYFPYGDDERITLTIGIRKKENVIDFEDNAFTKWLEEKCNVDLEFVYFSYDSTEYMTQVATMMAANEKLPDIFWSLSFTDDIRQQYDDDGYFVDMGQWLNDDEFMKDFELWDTLSNRDYFSESDVELFKTRNISATDGGWYHIGDFLAGSGDCVYSKMHINQTWLTKLGLEMPTNFEEFTEVLRAFRDQDPNGNGQKDEIPLVGSINTCEATTAWDDPIRWLINNWVFYNENYLFNATDGQLWLPAETDDYREALVNIKGLIDEKLLSTMVYTIQETSELKALYFPETGDQTVGAFCGHITKVNVTDNAGLYDYVGVTPFNYAPLNSSTIGSGVCITTDCEYPERAMRLILLTNSNEGSLRQRLGEPGVDWEEIQDPVDGHTRRNVINNDAFTGQTKSTWSLASTNIYNSNVEGSYWYNAVEYKEPVTEMSWTDYKVYLGRKPAQEYREQAAKTDPEEVVRWFPLNAEEIEEVGNIKTEYLSYIRQARAEFLTGVRDINSDADWNQYLDECRQIGNETLLKVYQSAYTRSKQ